MSRNLEASPGQRAIRVRGASEHNLQGIDLDIPRGTLTTVTGVSGSGKSSLAYDTIYREGHRRFVESLSAYARQFLGQGEKPRVETIDGLSPTVSVDQKTVNRNPRSTVGTITEVHDHLRLLFARLGTPHCHRCGVPITAQTPDQVASRILTRFRDRQVMVLGPIVRDRKGEYRKELKDLLAKGYIRARIDGEVVRLDEPVVLKRYERHTIEVIVDRVKAEPSRISRLTEAVEQAFRLGEGRMSARSDSEEEAFSALLSCSSCGVDVPGMEPRTFSFNSPHGACPACHGLGEGRDVDEGLCVPDPDLSLGEGAVAPSRKGGFSLRSQLGPKILRQVCLELGIPWDRPFEALNGKQRKTILWGSGERLIPLDLSFEGKRLKVKRHERRAWRGIIPILRDAWAERPRKSIEQFLAPGACSACGGSRLRPETLAVRFRGRNIHELSALPVSQLLAFVSGVELAGAEQQVGGRLLRELRFRLEFLDRVGLGYLSVHRSAATLSGGESQRIRLATQVGSRLRGILYVLDEPSIGLHQRDNQKLIETLRELRDAGNTVIVVEHDQETIEASDHVIDIGPGAGALGGRVVAEGTPEELALHPGSPTGAFLSGRQRIDPPPSRRIAGAAMLVVKGATENNLKRVDAPFPIGLLTCVTGVSGSGKSTLVDGILKRVLAQRFHGAQARPGAHQRVNGLHHLDKVIEISQSPIGRTPRSNPGTYTKVFDLIRDLFASLPESAARGYAKGRFSFNVKGGRCEECQGAGVKVMEMHFLPDVTIPCERCAGHRFNPETLEVRYRGKSINDILEMTVLDALEFFKNHPKIVRILSTLDRVGLGYITLGQPSTTLSGGEAQRIKLSSELHRPATGRTLYLLDEPTTGLHFLDVQRLLAALQTLVDGGNTVIVIEHNLDVVKCADWIVDLGPEGGEGGGEVLYAGPFEGILAAPRSETGRMLGELLAPRRRRKPKVRPVARDRALDGDIRILGARMHNLRGIDAVFPAGKLSVVTGLSGSGKTSLAFDTLFAEGQRRFVECLSTYARQFLGRLERPPLDAIEGLAPAIAIDQKNAGRNPRSTVATTTEIHDYLRILYARLGTPRCPVCLQDAMAAPPDAAVQRLLDAHRGERGLLLAPLYLRDSNLHTILSDPGRIGSLIPELREEGYLRLLIDRRVVRIDGKMEKVQKAKEIWLVVDRVQWKASARTRLLDSVQQAYLKGLGTLAFQNEEGARTVVTERPGCAGHGFLLGEELVPRMFSFNSQEGACTQCHGLGVCAACDPTLLIAHPDMPLFEGALIDRPGDFIARRDGYFPGAVAQLCKQMGTSVREPWNRLPARVREAILHGYGGEIALSGDSKSENREVSYEMRVRWKGLCRYVEDWRAQAKSDWWAEQLDRVIRQDQCPSCQGERLKPEFRAVAVRGATLPAVGRMTVREAMDWVASLQFDGAQQAVAGPVLKELKHRLGFLDSVGLEYLELDRSAATLSGGEAQRIRLATQIGNRLTGVIYVLDEPTVGLHPRDTARLLGTLRELRDLGNSLVVVEHDRETIDAADWIVDLGPGAGRHGGCIAYQGPRESLSSATTLTADYVSGRRCVERRARTPRLPAGVLSLQNVNRNNIRGLSVSIPAGLLVAVTGVSGSGKSTLVMDTLAPALAAALKGDGLPSGVGGIEGAGQFAQCITVDQSPLGTSPRSNPASYLGIFDAIRALMASTPEAKVRGFGPGRFSFNTTDGRCAACEGRGSVKIEMHFLPDVWVACEECQGRRFNRETLSVQYRGRNIAGILDLEVSEAVEFFENHRRIRDPLQLLHDVGLGYMQLGQSATTLSGGEAQRVKLAAQLGRRTAGPVLYILDEPTTGLHFDDVAKLLDVFQRLVDAGHTVLVIEHNLDVIASADHVIDLGPEGGSLGGSIVAEGPPGRVAECPRSHTGAALRSEWESRNAAPTENLCVEASS